MIMLEDLRLALRQICQAIGLREMRDRSFAGCAGVALNLARCVQWSMSGWKTHLHDRTALQSAAQTD